jgi:hypothetical protein
VLPIWRSAIEALDPAEQKTRYFRPAVSVASAHSACVVDVTSTDRCVVRSSCSGCKLGYACTHATPSPVRRTNVRPR